MKDKIGIWLDRTNAIIMRLSDTSYETVLVNSAIKDARHPRCGTEGHCTMVPEKKLKQRKQEIIKKYYSAIIDNIRDASEIFVLGPGMAKTEFVNELRASKDLQPKVVGFMSSEKMSIRQLYSELKVIFESGRIERRNRSSLLCTLSD